MLNLSGVTQQPGVPLTEEEVAQVQVIKPVPGKSGLYVIGGLDGNPMGGQMAVLVTNDGVLLVDDKLPRSFSLIIEQVRQVTTAPIRYVLSSHHHGDHTGSNGVFTEIAETMMHRNARANMVRGNQAGPGHITYNDEASVHIGGVEVRMHYFGRGHTDGDSIISFPSLGVIHTGDLVSDGQRSDGSTLTPVFDYNNGGSALEFPQTLDGALRLDWDLAIPGHGFIKDRTEVRGFRDRVDQLGGKMAAYIAAGGAKDDIETKFDCSDLGWPVVGNFVRALGNVYDEVAAARK